MVPLRTVAGSIQYAVKHAVAFSAVLSAVTGFVLVGYLGLLAWAVVAGAPLGGPLALPFLLVVAVLAGTAAALGVLGPVTAFGGFLRKKAFPRHALAEIPLTTLVMTGYLILLGMVASVGFGGPAAAGFRYGLIGTVLLLVPLGVYWWALQAAAALLDLGAHLALWIRGALSLASVLKSHSRRTEIRRPRCSMSS
ncbi:MAG TPA: hypothetical protein DD490_22635 [Acidobacteria bacterium]|nr:hypothetical protein [Acidobacteriota bacterium]